MKRLKGNTYRYTHIHRAYTRPSLVVILDDTWEDFGIEKPEKWLPYGAKSREWLAGQGRATATVL